mmetsp:Transcript_2891/g.6420  ORF Transcript_2891/g.6420 Transcript_2891/m.6420 type:complete len:100 (+) Transcript_2891:645-944(+)
MMHDIENSLDDDVVLFLSEPLQVIRELVHAELSKGDSHNKAACIPPITHNNAASFNTLLLDFHQNLVNYWDDDMAVFYIPDTGGMKGLLTWQETEDLVI